MQRDMYPLRAPKPTLTRAQRWLEDVGKLPPESVRRQMALVLVEADRWSVEVIGCALQVEPRIRQVAA
ncbi:MAG: hypothetical protein FWD29_03350 [Micrococcales bacterium]|nr:hypothetical protein [Micrococcales bacterium]